ncbi:MAG: hypothetical protein ACREDP_12730, partial [Bradyrhizobium sp.]
MSMKPIRAAIAGAVLVLSACTNTGQPASSAGASASSPSTSTQTASTSPPATSTGTTATNSPLQLNSGNFQPEGVTPGQPTGTLVGKKVEDLRADLTRLQVSVADENK